jgi:hypothetical protein
MQVRQRRRAGIQLFPGGCNATTARSLPSDCCAPTGQQYSLRHEKTIEVAASQRANSCSIVNLTFRAGSARRFITRSAVPFAQWHGHKAFFKVVVVTIEFITIGVAAAFPGA